MSPSHCFPDETPDCDTSFKYRNLHEGPCEIPEAPLPAPRPRLTLTSFSSPGPLGDLLAGLSRTFGPSTSNRWQAPRAQGPHVLLSAVTRHHAWEGRIPSDWWAQCSTPKLPCGPTVAGPPPARTHALDRVEAGVGCAQAPSSPPRGAANRMQHDSTRGPGARGTCDHRARGVGAGQTQVAARGLGLSPVRGMCLPPLPLVTQGSLQTG